MKTFDEALKEAKVALTESEKQTLTEMFTPSTDENAKRNLGDKVLKDGKEKRSTVLFARIGYLKFVEPTTDGIIIHEINGGKHVSIVIDNDEMKYLKK